MIELGQMAFGNPVREYECPLSIYIEEGLERLSEEIERIEWNKTQKVFQAPTRNSGTHYKTDAFEMHAYYWGDCDCEVCEPSCPTKRPNFKCEDLEVSWYKYLGRGMSMNKPIDANDFFELIDKCMDSMNSGTSDWDYENQRWS